MTNDKRRVVSSILVGGLMVFSGSAASAQSDASAWALSQPAATEQGAESTGKGAAASDSSTVVPTEDKRFHWAISPYLWMPSLSGSVTVKGVKTDINESFIDILDASDRVFGLMGAIDASYDRFVFQVNAAWMTAEVKDQESGRHDGTLKADMTFDTTWLEFFGGYRFVDNKLGEDPASKRRLALDGFVGGRVTWLDTDTTLKASAAFTLPDGSVLGRDASRDISASENWIEPFVGARLAGDLTENWSAVLRGDVGGFGVDGSQFSWQAVGGIGYRWHYETWNFALYAGYRALGQDYENGDFEWDMIVHGPIIGMQFSF